ncbi:hypothetical protein F1529_03655 [Alcanivorax sp. VBW004]|uniref:Uncharacterized protein n=1 Tax=Alcanivorax jadensis T9 TaxID=1177181 RepID=A0ABR4WFQ3_9GAMM|nr:MULTISPECIES: hypothetical protein [Alcanivorax]KGD62383.1 hypothetical protein T9A_00674 [Alcanivorax jadensis T9]MTT51574.1 hypothetical protein [Alcanivorax sp. VBW004]
MPQLTDQLQSFIYDLDKLIDRGSYDSELLALRRRIFELLSKKQAIEIKKATTRYHEAIECLSEAKESVTRCLGSLSSTAEMIDKVTKVVNAVQKLFD